MATCAVLLFYTFVFLNCGCMLTVFTEIVNTLFIHRIYIKRGNIMRWNLSYLTALIISCNTMSLHWWTTERDDLLTVERNINFKYQSIRISNLPFYLSIDLSPKRSFQLLLCFCFPVYSFHLTERIALLTESHERDFNIQQSFFIYREDPEATAGVAALT